MKTIRILPTLLLSLACQPAAQVPPKASDSASASESEKTTAHETPAAPHPSAHGGEEKAIYFKALSVEGSLVASMPVAVTSFGLAEAAGKVYVMGGYHGIPHAYSVEGQSAHVLALDPKNPGTWLKVSEMSQGLQGLASAGYKDEICQFGGLLAKNTKGNPADLHSVATARCLNVKTKEWRELPPLPKSRSSHDAAIFGSKVYVGGGWQLSGTPRDSVWLNDVAVFDFEDEKAGWQVIETPFQARAVGVGVDAAHLVIAGGITPEGRPSSKVRVYDFAQKKWLEGPDFPADAFGLALTSTAGRMLASGRDGLLRELNLSENKWVPLRALGFPRFFHQLALIDDQVLVIGGIGGMHMRGRTRVVELLPVDPSITSWGRIDLENPSNAKNRQGYIWNDEQVYVFGGNNSLGQHDFLDEHFEEAGFIYDFATLKYRPAPSYPQKRQSMITYSTEDGGLAVGGFGVAQEGSAGSETEEAFAGTQSGVYAFDWEAMSWTSESPLPLGRTQFGLIHERDEDWILGGLNYSAERKGLAAFDHRLDLLNASDDTAQSEKETFKVIAEALPGPRRAFAGALFNGKYYMVGGMKEAFALVDNCLTFELATRIFAEFPCPGPARLSGSLIEVAEKLYLVGGSIRGEEGMEESRNISVYDPKTNQWSDLGYEIPMSVRHLRAFAFHDQIALISMHHEEKRLSFALLNPGR